MGSGSLDLHERGVWAGDAGPIPADPAQKPLASDVSDVILIDDSRATGRGDAAAQADGPSNREQGAPIEFNGRSAHAYVKH